MANKKRTFVLSDSENSSDEDFHQSHPKKRPRLPDQQEAGFDTGITSADPDVITTFPSVSNDIYSDFNIIVVSDDDDYLSGEETSSPKRLRTSDIVADDAPEHCGSPQIYILSDGEYNIITPSSPVTDTESSGCLERSTSEEQPICGTQGWVLMDLTSPASPYVQDFPNTKYELVTWLFKIFNSTVFESKLPESNIEIKWSKRLRVSAGNCRNTFLDGELYSIIQLSEKVCDSAERLRDTLLHEMCHAACWHLNGVQVDGHGPFWVSYTEQAARVHPELPPVSVYHTFDIKYKYNYVCAGCGRRVGRFTKICKEKQYCRKCGGKLLMENI
ncbi:germ cell nuclear acidic protein-like [Ranitomeya variabilis]|uniref:germ cell nuclear acidic protein-like n=1 Tax=Ranitomeya variabilis TaxID=490064 RepID=UPI0040577708